MKLCNLFLFIGVCIDSLYFTQSMTGKGRRRKQTVVFFDNFDSAEIDLTKWEHEVTAWGGGNEEFQTFVPDEENSFVRHGKLHIKPTLMEDKIDPRTNEKFGSKWLSTGVYNLTELYGWCTEKRNWGCYRDRGNIPPIASARLQTKSYFSFMYGTVEIIAKLPKGDWLWPALWMVPFNHTTNLAWPYDGEIDLVEARGNTNLTDLDGTSVGINFITSAMHMCKVTIRDRFIGKMKLRNSTWADGFHNYTLKWKPDSIIMYVDGDIILSYHKKKAGGFDRYCRDHIGEWKINKDDMFPFNKPYYLILSLAVGGRTGFFHQNFEPKKPWNNDVKYSESLRQFYDARNQWYPTWKESELVVDSVKVTQESDWEEDISASTIICGRRNLVWILALTIYISQDL